MSLATVSKATMNDCMRRLAKTYEESSGKTYGGEGEDIVDTTGLSPFEALKILIGKKIETTRKTIEERNEVARTRQGGERRKAKLNNDIKKMIRVIVGDYEKLREIHAKSLKQMTFLKSKDTIEKKKIQDEKNGETLVIIGQNIVALENEDRKRFGIEDNKVVQAVNKVKQQLLGVNLGDGDDIPLPKTTNLKSENLDELGFDDAPELDITQSLMRVDQNKAEIEKGLEIFSQKLDQLSDMAGNISTELDDQGRILDDLDRKASNELERLKNLNKKVESALEKSGGLLRWIFVLVGAIIFCAVVAAIYVLVQNYITPIVRAFD